jgi:hypothetical protein
MMTELILQGDAADLSANHKMHFRERDRRRDAWTLRTRDAWNRAGCPVFTSKIRLSFVVYRGRVLDHDNISGSLSLTAICNALKGRAFKDDSPRYVVRGTVEQVTGARYRKCPAVVVRIEAVAKEGESSLS